MSNVKIPEINRLGSDYLEPDPKGRQLNFSLKQSLLRNVLYYLTLDLLDLRMPPDSRPQLLTHVSKSLADSLLLLPAQLSRLPPFFFTLSCAKTASSMLNKVLHLDVFHIKTLGSSISALARLPHFRKHVEFTVRLRSPTPFQLRTYRALEDGRNNKDLKPLHQKSSIFQYTSLKRNSSPGTKHFIRLIELLPGRDSIPVKCTLKVVPLSDGLDYEALSYCWGDQRDQTPIFCNGQQLFVPTTLEIALRNMRYPDMPRVLWADAICINQSDVAEKEHQVQLMRTIFSYSQRTLVWLGDVNEKRQHKMSKFTELSIKLGLSMLRRRVDLLHSPRVSVWNDDERCYRTLAPFGAEFYLDLIGMLRMPWFQRAWVVQEVAVSSRATIFWGSAQYDWENLIRALKFMSQVNFPLAFIVTLENISAIEEERSFYRNGFNKLYSVLLRHQRCLATDPRDKIYSFSGLIETSSRPQDPVRISYHDDVAAIYQETAVQILEQDRSLDLLSRPPLSAVSSIKGLPSWVPDWSISSASTLTYSWGNGPLSLAGTEIAIVGQKPRFSAASHSLYSSKVSSSVDTLVVEGYAFDKVIEVGPIFQGVQVPHTVQSVVGIVSEWIKCIHTLLRARKVFIRWQQVANVRSKDPYFTGETIREAFWQTVSTGELHDSARVKMELGLWERAARFPFGLPYSAFVFFWNFITNRPFLLFEIQGRFALQRRLIRTGRGYLGLASRSTGIGDDVMLCKGSGVPLILRRKDNAADLYQLIGDIYVHGIMNGEAFQAGKCRILHIS